MPLITNEDIEIKKKYLKSPTIQEIQSFIKEVGVSVIQFERFYNMPKRTLFLTLGGHRALPVKYWPIFYDRIIPAYGAQWVKDQQEKAKSSQNTPQKSGYTRSVTQIKGIKDDRLSKL
jgi:hypothetical protein